MDHQQPQTQDQGAIFAEVMKGLTHEWGFVVVRTATTFTDDQTSTALASLRATILASQDSSAEMDPATLALPVLHLPGANLAAARSAFTDWVRAYDDAGGEWDSDVRRDVFLALDDAAVASLLAADGEAEAWAVVVDARHREGGAARPDYHGHMRCLARALPALFEDLEGDRRLEAMCPPRQYADQIPLFDGSPRGKVLEPDHPPEGPRVEFPRGTQRGTQRGQGGTRRGV